MKHDDITPSDNTRVYTFINEYPELTHDQKLKQLKSQIYKNQGQIYDADKIKYYSDLQNFYNQNAFGYGIQGTPTRYNPASQRGRQMIQSNLNYATNNSLDFLSNMVGSYIGSYFKGVLPTFSSRKTVGQLSHLIPYEIGEGAESIIIKNSPFSVGRITQTGRNEIIKRNLVPNTLPNKFIGYVKDGVNRFPTYVQKKVKILDDTGFNKHVNKLDKAMSKVGWKRINDPNVYGRAYTNGSIVVDDIAPGNVGLDWLRRPRIIDSNVQTIPEWLAQGYKLKNGGKLNANK